MWPKGKLNTHCKRGHEFTPENIKMTGGARTCRICDRARRRAQLERRKEADRKALEEARACQP